MDDIQKYAEEWELSAKFFYGKGYYSWMAAQLNGHNTVLEIGCGTGYSTLALVKQGFSVISIDKNQYCIEYAKKLIAAEGYSDRVIFIQGDIVDDNLKDELLNHYKFDAIALWNVGTSWSREMLLYYSAKMQEYGLSDNQISEDPESSYTELIIYHSLRLASVNKTSIQFIERTATGYDSGVKDYYGGLMNEFRYVGWKVQQLEGISLSKAGRQLSLHGKEYNSEEIPIVFLSIIFNR